MKLQQNPQGTYHLNIPKAVVSMLGWEKHDEIELKPGSSRGSIELRKK